MVEPIFPKSAVRMIAGAPAVYSLTSSGSGKRVDVHFCPTCGTKTHLGFERFPDVYGVYGGTFDNPSWFDRTPDATACLFFDDAQRGAIFPAGVPVYGQHRMNSDGSANTPMVFDTPIEVAKS